MDDNSYFMSIITNATDIGLKQFKGKYIGPREIMQWTNSLLHPIFDGLNNMKFDILEHVDYVLMDNDNIKKIAGNAQKISRDRFDHHTSWLWKYDIDLINKYLAIPPKKNQPDYRKNRTHKDFLLCLDELFNDDINNLESKLLEQLNTMFEIKEISLDDMLEIVGDFKQTPIVNNKPLTLKTKIINDKLKELHTQK